MLNKGPTPIRVGYVRDHARRSERVQRAALKARGVDRIYSDWDLLVRQRRKGHGDIVEVTDLWVLPDPSRRTVKGGLRRSLIERRAQLRALGVTIFEVQTGLSTANEAEADAMLANALDVLAGTKERGKKIGRKPKAYSDDQVTIMRLHWLAIGKHRTNRDALAAMAADGVVVSGQKVNRLLGPSGRMPGPQPKSKRKS
jgi:hypothetical protein